VNQIPIQVYLFPALAIGAVIFFVIYRRFMVARHDQTYANYRAGELAQRLGLQLVEGDPTFNFFIRHANVDVARGPSDGRPVHISVRMQGQPQGVPIELVYLYRVEQETGLVTVTWRTWFDCRMVAHARQAFPPFEVISRNAPLGPIAMTMPLPPVPTGNPMVDSTYAVATQEPGMAQMLGQTLGAFAQFANSGIHLVGDGRTISFVMKQDKAPLLANALYYAEVMSGLMADLARRAGG
jgi:hypothetical protein